MNILITGCNGQLGNEMRAGMDLHDDHQYFLTDITAEDESLRLDITDKAAVLAFMHEHRIELVVNCAAYTNVDKAEEDEATARKINCDAVRNLAEVACKHNCLLVHISTDYVFSGEACHPYKEDDMPAPKSVYGASKLAGELAVAEVGCRAIIIRTSWLYSEYGRNFVKTMLQLGRERDEVSVVCDQIGGPTYAGDLARVIYRLMENGEEPQGTEIYHFANEGVCSWFDFAKTIMDIAGLPCRVEAIPSSEYPAKAHRPAFSVFNLRKIKVATGTPIPYWRDSLILTINKLKQK